MGGLVRLNRGMDGTISATPAMVKGQLASAAVASAPEGSHYVDSLANKTPAQVGTGPPACPPPRVARPAPCIGI